MYKKLLLLFILLSFVGCAGYSIKPQWDKNLSSGYQVYAPHPHLLVNTTIANNMVTQTASIIYLPDYSKPYKVRTWNFLGKADFSFTFDQGWNLTAISDKSDNTAATKEFANTAIKLLGLTTQAVSPTADGTAVYTAKIYRLVFDETNGHLIRLAPVNIPVPQAPKSKNTRSSGSTVEPETKSPTVTIDPEKPDDP